MFPVPWRLGHRSIRDLLLSASLSPYLPISPRCYLRQVNSHSKHFGIINCPWQFMIIPCPNMINSLSDKFVSLGMDNKHAANDVRLPLVQFWEVLLKQACPKEIQRLHDMQKICKCLNAQPASALDPHRNTPKLYTRSRFWVPLPNWSVDPLKTGGAPVSIEAQIGFGHGLDRSLSAGAIVNAYGHLGKPGQTQSCPSGGLTT